MPARVPIQEPPLPTSTLKVLYLNYLYDLDGVSLGSAVKARCLLGALQDRGHQVKICWRNPFPEGRKTSDAEEPNKGRFKLGLKNGLSRWLNFPASMARSISDIRAESELVKSFEPDVLISRLEAGRFSATTLSKRFSLPLVIEADCPVIYEQRHYHADRHLPPWIPEKVEMRCLEQSHHVFTPSQTLADYYIKRGIPAEKVTPIENGVHAERFPEDLDGEKARNAHGLNDRLVVGFLGSLAPWHDVDGLIRAFDRVLDARPEASALVVGGGGGAAESFKVWHQNRSGDGRVVWIPHAPHEEVAPLLAAMDVILLPAPKFEFPYFSPVKLFESMAAGKIVVAARQGQVAEIIEDEVNGLLYEPGNSDELASQALKAAAHPRREEIGSAARDSIMPKYTWDAQAEKLEKILLSAASCRAKG